MNPRRAYTLVEMLVVIATTSAMLAVGVGVLHLLTRLERASREAARIDAAVSRLADQFRRDVHAADRFEAVPRAEGEKSPPAWQLTAAPDGVVEYQVGQEGLVRTQRKGDEVLQRDLFGLPTGAAVSIAPAGETAPGIVRLEVGGGAGASRNPAWRGTLVEAQLAKDGRFVKQKP